jgi:hypothetical protein
VLNSLEAGQHIEISRSGIPYRVCGTTPVRQDWLSKVELPAEIEFRDSLPKTLVSKHSKRRTSGPSAQRKANLLGLSDRLVMEPG